MNSPSTSRFKVVSVGEVLWDLFPEGALMGGAPANVGIHARALGADARLVSRVGRDELGDEIVRRFAERGFPTDTIQRSDTAPTGTVDVQVDSAGQPHFTICENVAWDAIAADESALEAVRGADAVCFGSLTQRCEASREAIHTLVSATDEKALRIFDVNLRAPFISREIIEASLTIANVLKLNDTEVPVLAEMFGLAGADDEALAGALAKRFNLSVVACTRGARGSMIWTRDHISTHPGVPVQVRDTVGAGDAFTAALMLGLLRKRSLDEINQHANEVAAFVCSQPGATPLLPDALRNSV